MIHIRPEHVAARDPFSKLSKAALFNIQKASIPGPPGPVNEKQVLLRMHSFLPTMKLWASSKCTLGAR